jgi:fluoride ion exporter CrcB/FEX
LNITWKSLALVFAGGTLGTLLRLSFDLSLGSLFSVVAVNIIGSGVIGWINSDQRIDRVGRRQFWAVGFSGGFTTMSGVALLMASGITASLSAGQVIDSQVFGFVIGIFVASLLAYWGAYAIGQRLSGNKRTPIKDAGEVNK